MRKVRILITEGDVQYWAVAGLCPGCYRELAGRAVVVDRPDGSKAVYGVAPTALRLPGPCHNCRGWLPWSRPEPGTRVRVLWGRDRQ